MTTLRSMPRAKDVMVPEPVCVEPSTTVRQLARIFEEHEISGAPVVDKEGRVIGIVTKTDLIRRCSEGTLDVPPAYLFEVLSDQGAEDDEIIPEALVCVEDFMTEDPFTAEVRFSSAPAAAAGVCAEAGVHRSSARSGATKLNSPNLFIC